YRHATPSGPWPWTDFDVDTHTSSSLSAEVDHTWKGYPQNLFGNWTPEQVVRSGMLTNCHSGTCGIYTVDVVKDGTFDKDMASKVLNVPVSGLDEFWENVNVKVTTGITVQ
ncbi:hypothetical protein EDD15DRAFT_2285207, partial [Pisolithus albus]